MSLYGVTTNSPSALRTAYAEVELVGPRQALRNRLRRMREADEAAREEAVRAAARRRAECTLAAIAANLSTARPYTNRRREIIQQVIDAHPGLTLNDLRGPSRERRHVRPRQLAMRRLHAELGLSLSEVGAIFNRDHTTAMYSVQRGAQ